MTKVNGYDNRDTWLVVLWFHNDKDLYDVAKTIKSADGMYVLAHNAMRDGLIKDNFNPDNVNYDEVFESFKNDWA